MKTTTGETVNVLMKDLIGKRVKTRREMQNGFGVIASGTECIVDNTPSSAGFSLISPQCSHCKMRIRISRVHRDDLLLVVDEHRFIFWPKGGGSCTCGVEFLSENPDTEFVEHAAIYRNSGGLLDDILAHIKIYPNGCPHQNCHIPNCVQKRT